MSQNHAPKADTQFSLFLVNKPGTLARVLQQLAGSKVNIVAMSMMDSTEHGVLRLVPEDPGRVRDALRSLDVPATEQQVLVVTLPNRPGALADVVERLASERINVDYAYCTAGGARGGRSVGIFKVSNLKKAVQVLSERKPRRRQMLPVKSRQRARVH